ncbi:hypothetical protein FS749_009217 [Ceratobasidium sp. UAMH 11750]|nr:hypothetical protein FS749_009217 [Ceratobasidium sp. UAMH 11750]
MRSATFAIVAALAACVAASPSLKLTVSGPHTVTDVDNLTVKATVTNTGSETVKLLKDPRTVLSDWRTNTFAIEGVAGTPAFTGIKVKYSPELALKSGDESKFTVLAPGQSFGWVRDLAGVYNFTGSGAGEYKVFSAGNIFQYVDASGKLATVAADTWPHKLSVGGKLASLKGTPRSDRQNQITTAANSANTYVANARKYLAGISSGTTRYTSHFSDIGTDPTSTTYDCTW